MNARGRRDVRRERYFVKLIEAQLIGAVTGAEFMSLKKDSSRGLGFVQKLINRKRLHP